MGLYSGADVYRFGLGYIKPKIRVDKVAVSFTLQF